MSAVAERSVFHVNLNIEQVDSDSLSANNNARNSANLSRKSWKLQLLRLVQEAPRPIPVLCTEPRLFPHFGTNNKRISESSWTSNATYSTDVTETESDSASFTISVERKGVREGQEEETFSKDVSSSAFQSSCGGATEKLYNADLTSPVEEDTEKSANNTECSQKTKNSGNAEIVPQHPQKLSNSSTSTAILPIPQDNQVQGKDGKSRNASSSLSIQRDSEYWEKFRYSKDYQSSLMIETICNEVFNLKPSPRYKSLMKLSQKNKGRAKKTEEKENGSPQLLLTESSHDTNEKGIQAVVSDKQGKGTKDGLKTFSGRRSLYQIESNGKSNQLCFNQRVRSSYDDDDNDGVGPDGDKVEVEKEHGHLERYKEHGRKESYLSTTSSVFTVTTVTSAETEDESYRGYWRASHSQRGILYEGFGSVFHGYLTRRETESLLRNEGQYLIRQVWKEDGLILSFRFIGEVLNYRIICEAGASDITTSNETSKSNNGGNGPSTESSRKYRYFLENRHKCYYSLDELVQEGLLTLYLDENAGSYIDLLVELAQSQQNDNFLQTPVAVTPMRKTSRSASFRSTRIASSASAATDAGADGGGSHRSSRTAVRNSMEITLLIHYFEEEIIENLTKCQVCSRGLWGSSNKGMRCRDCSLVVHEACIDNVKNECKPDLRRTPPFSTDLTTLVKGNRLANGTYGPPYILEKCINELEARGLDAEGIYRISGSVDEIENLKNLFERDTIDTDLSVCEDLYSIAALVKNFLRHLPDSLITKEMFDEYLREERGEMKLEEVQALLYCLPPAHRVTLKYLLDHLNRVAQEKGSNKMSPFNLASIFLPSMVGPQNMSFAVLESGTKLIHFLIVNAANLRCL